MIQLNEHTNEEILAKDDELSLIMLINKLQSSNDFKDLILPSDYMDRVARTAPKDILDVIARVTETLLWRINVPEDEIAIFTDNIWEGRKSMLFVNFEPYDFQATRREACEEGKEINVISLICKIFIKGKSETQIADELEDNISRISEICDTARKFTPEYDVEKIYEALHEAAAIH